MKCLFCEYQTTKDIISPYYRAEMLTHIREMHKDDIDNFLIEYILSGKKVNGE